MIGLPDATPSTELKAKVLFKKCTEDSDYNRLLMINKLQAELIDVQEKLYYRSQRLHDVPPEKPADLEFVTIDNMNTALPLEDLEKLNSYITQLIRFKTKKDALHKELSELRNTKNKLQREIYYIQRKKEVF